ncbi:MAG: cobalamin biosynthesis protein, partial [Oricola sp.]
AGLHRSPNAGWPESAMAAAVGVALGGPRIYAGGDRADDPFLNVTGRHTASEKDIGCALSVFWRAMTIFAVVVAILAMISSRY